MFKHLKYICVDIPHAISFRFIFFREPWKRKFLVCKFLEGRIKKRKKKKNNKIKGGNKRRFYNVIISTNLEQNNNKTLRFHGSQKNNVNAFSALQKFRCISNYTYDHLNTPTSVAIRRNIILGQRMKYFNEHTICSSFNLASMMVI